MHERFHISLDDRRRHLYVIGKTGVGKSTFLENLIESDFADRGFCLIDPHGTTAENVADRMPPHRTNDVIYLDPADLSASIAFNPLESVPYDLRPLAASQIVASFKAIWGNSWGPRMEYILYNCLRVLLDTPSTLLGLPRLLTDKRYRERLTARCSDPMIRAFWTDEFEAWDERFRKEAVSPIQNKVGALLGTPSIRNIIGQPHSTLRISRIMNERKILIANLSKGKLGEGPSNLIGALLVNAFAQGAESRANIKEEDRQDFALYIDEFQNFATDSFATILSESRKWRLQLCLAHQYLGQLPPPLRQAVFGNVGAMVVFRVGAEDAPLLAAELGWNSPGELTNLSNYQARYKTITDGVVQDARLLRTSPSSASLGRLDAIRRQTRDNDARPRAIVEDAIERFLRGS